MKIPALALLLLSSNVWAQGAPAAAVDPWKPLAFLEGTWDAKTDGRSAASTGGVMYVLEGSVMRGRFQVQPPGQSRWMSYLEWSGARR